MWPCTIDSASHLHAMRKTMPALSGSGGVSKVLHAMCHPPGPFGRIREPIHKVSMGCSKKKILIQFACHGKDYARCVILVAHLAASENQLTFAPKLVCMGRSSSQKINICMPWERLSAMRYPRGPFGRVRETPFQVIIFWERPWHRKKYREEQSKETQPNTRVIFDSVYMQSSPSRCHDINAVTVCTGMSWVFSFNYVFDLLVNEDRILVDHAYIVLTDGLEHLNQVNNTHPLLYI